MPSRFIIVILAVLYLVFTGCNSSSREPGPSGSLRKNAHMDSLFEDRISDTTTFRGEDTTSNEYLADRLKPIKENFRRINAITKWSSIDRKELEESTEGGEARYYYAANRLEKIVVRLFGETYQQVTEYYLLEGRLSFVFNRSYRYNRPFYYDSVTMRENNDTEVFDFKKSTIVEERDYFEKDKLIYQVSNQVNPDSSAKNYLLEQEKGMLEDFGRLMVGRR